VLDISHSSTHIPKQPTVIQFTQHSSTRYSNVDTTLLSQLKPHSGISLPPSTFSTTLQTNHSNGVQGFHLLRQERRVHLR
jgi:hypothetical protein